MDCHGGGASCCCRAPAPCRCARTLGLITCAWHSPRGTRAHPALRAAGTIRHRAPAPDGTCKAAGKVRGARERWQAGAVPRKRIPLCGPRATPAPSACGCLGSLLLGRLRHGHGLRRLCVGHGLPRDHGRGRGRLRRGVVGLRVLCTVVAARGHRALKARVARRVGSQAARLDLVGDGLDAEEVPGGEGHLHDHVDEVIVLPHEDGGHDAHHRAHNGQPHEVLVLLAQLGLAVAAQALDHRVEDVHEDHHEDDRGKVEHDGHAAHRCAELAPAV
mmetsp:Transcript_10090/g.34308  ORF Transcript_10090/g.34308 Transcript_10090/m.34308 type:complete len:274 (+) Transcript_10090:195-1016(+)